MKVPTEILFIDCQNPRQFTYKAADFKKIGVDNKIKPMPHGQKGILDIADCNLVHRMIAKGLKMDKSIKYLLDTFKLQDSQGQY